MDDITENDISGQGEQLEWPENDAEMINVVVESTQVMYENALKNMLTEALSFATVIHHARLHGADVEALKLHDETFSELLHENEELADSVIDEQLEKILPVVYECVSNIDKKVMSCTKKK